MDVVFLEGLTQYGVIGGLLIFLVWQSVKREDKLMTFLNDMKAEMAIISSSLKDLSEDQRDIRRKMGMKSNDKDSES